MPPLHRRRLILIRVRGIGLTTGRFLPGLLTCRKTAGIGVVAQQARTRCFRLAQTVGTARHGTLLCGLPGALPHDRACGGDRLGRSSASEAFLLLRHDCHMRWSVGGAFDAHLHGAKIGRVQPYLSYAASHLRCGSALAAPPRAGAPAEMPVQPPRRLAPRPAASRARAAAARLPAPRNGRAFRRRVCRLRGRGCRVCRIRACGSAWPAVSGHCPCRNQIRKSRLGDAGIGNRWHRRREASRFGQR